MSLHTGGAIAHVGIAVGDIDSAIETYRVLCPELIIGPRVAAVEQGVEVCFLDFPSNPVLGRIELITDIPPGHKISDFIAKRGEGLHHVCFTCENLVGKLAELSAAGFRLIDATPRIGALGRPIAFVHPSSTGGVLVEFEEESISETKR